VQEPNGQRENGHVRGDVPPRPPGAPDGTAGEEGSTSAQKDRDQQKNTERLLVEKQL